MDPIILTVPMVEAFIAALTTFLNEHAGEHPPKMTLLGEPKAGIEVCLWSDGAYVVCDTFGLSRRGLAHAVAAVLSDFESA